MGQYLQSATSSYPAHVLNRQLVGWGNEGHVMDYVGARTALGAV